MLSTALDLDADGFHAGYIDVPASLNHSAWANLRVPLFSIKRGEGPCCLLLGGCHGDEYEGPIALSSSSAWRAEAGGCSGTDHCHARFQLPRLFKVALGSLLLMMEI